MPRPIMVFTSFDAVILPLEKRGEVEQILPCLYWSDADVYHSRREQRGAVGSSQSGLTQNLTLSNFLAIYFGFLCMKNYNLNPQTTSV